MDRLHPPSGEDSPTPPADARPADSGWREFAWNGLRLALPPDWEPARIGDRHLLFESGSGPVLEVKWGPVRGRFSHLRTFRRLRTLATAAGTAPRGCPLPAAWEPALSRFDAKGFCWAAGGRAATGAIFHCGGRRSGGLIQFFHPPPAYANPRHAAAVLARLGFQDPDGNARWAVFDIRAELPAGFRLIRHRFEPGSFTLHFAAGRCRVELCRWAPAAVLLGNGGLEGFARRLKEWGPLRFERPEGASSTAVEGWTPAPDGPIARLAARVGGRPVRRARLWHVAARNRILGVCMQDRGGIDAGLWEKVIAAYGVVAVQTAADARPPG
jgi:hypothetical protein